MIVKFNFLFADIIREYLLVDYWFEYEDDWNQEMFNALVDKFFDFLKTVEVKKHDRKYMEEETE